MKSILPFFHSSNFLFILITTLFITACKREVDSSIQTQELNLAYNYQNTADSLLALNKYDRAFNTYLLANQYFEKSNKTESITYNNLQISTIYLTIGDPNSAQEILTQELTKIQSKDTSYKVFLYNALANCYVELNDYLLANKYYTLSLELASDEQSKAIIHNNIALNKIALKEYDSAITILQAINTANTLQNSPLEQARVLNNLGKALYLKNHKEGLKELKQALAIRLVHGNPNDLYRSYIALAEYYVLNQNYSTAQQYALEAYHNSIESKSHKDKLQSLEYLIKSKAQNNSVYLKEYIELSKEIYTTNQQAKNQFAKIRYDFEQHEQENTKLKLALQHIELIAIRKDNTILVLLITAILASLIISYTYRKIKQRHRKEKIEQAYKTETNIAKKIHDELANDVFNTLTYIQNFTLDNPEAKNHLVADLEAIYKKARNISLQHSSIATDQTFINHLTNLFNEYNTASCQIIITGLHKFNWDNLDPNQKITIYRVIQELLVNMKKHSMATLVVFKFSEENKFYNLFYSDNGVGIIQTNINSKNGLSNVENRITNIGGTFIFDKENAIGVKYNIQLPKKNYV